MSRFKMGWHTTHEVEEHGYPVRFSLTEDDHTDVAFCRTQSAAQVVVDALNHMHAKPAEFIDHFE